MSFPRACSTVLLAVALLAESRADEPKDVPADPLPAGAKAQLGNARYRIPAGYAPVVLSADTRWLLYQAGGEGKINFLDSRTGRVDRQVPLPDVRGLSGLAISQNGKRVAVTVLDEVVVLDADSGQSLTRIKARVFGIARAEPAFCFSADGNRIAVGGMTDGRQRPIPVIVWDVAANKEVCTLNPIQSGAAYVALSADGKTLLTWGQHSPSTRPAEREPGPPPDRVAQVWDVDKQAERVQVISANATVFKASISPDGSRIALTGSTNLIEVFDAATGKPIQTFTGGFGNRGAGAMIFSPDAKALAATGRDGYVYLWELASGKRLGMVESPIGAATGLVFAPGDRVVAWGRWGDRVALWELPSGKLLTAVEGHASEICSIVFPAGGKTLLTGGTDSQALEWDIGVAKVSNRKVLRAPERYKVSDQDQPRRSAVILSPDGIHAAVTDYKLNQLGVYPAGGLLNRTTGTVSVALPTAAATDAFEPALFSPDGDRFIFPGSRWKARPADPTMLPIWETSSGRKVAEVAVPGEVDVSAAFSLGGTKLVTAAGSRAAGDHSLMVTGWDLKTGTKLGFIPIPSRINVGYSVGATDDTTAVVASSEGKAWVVDYAAGRVLFTLEETAPQIHRPAKPVVSPDGKWLAVGVGIAEPGKPIRYGVRLYGWPAGKAAHTFLGHAGAVTALAFSADGKTLASGSADTTVMLWDMAAVGK